MKFTTYGDVRGGCGKVYDTAEEAHRAVMSDAHGCRRQYGYSDRQVAVIGDDGYLYTYDDGGDGLPSNWIAGPGGRTSGGVKFSDA